VEKEFFQVVYDGEALVTNEMDIRDLAPALMAISDVFEEANKITYGDKTKVQVNVKGTFKSGSFGVDLSVFQTGLNGIVSLFNSNEINAAANLLGILGIPGGGLIGLLLWLRNRKIKSINKIDDSNSSIEVEDGETYKTSPQVIALFSSIRIRTSIQKVVTEPLSRQGIDKFKIKRNDAETTVEKQEKDCFKLSEIPDELLKDQEREVFLKVITISFSEGHKWRFSDGGVEFYAEISDSDFINQVQENKDGFFKDDLLKVTLREKQWISDSGIKSEYEIIRVLEHRSASKQIKLPFEN